MFDTLKTFPILRRRRFHGGFIVERNVREVFHYGELARRSLGYCAPGRGGNDRVGIVGKAYYDLCHGIDFKSSINIGWQAVADSLLRAALPEPKRIEGACLLLLDIRDGSIPVIVNLGHYGDSVALGEYYNYAIGFGYEPGAVMEPLSWLVALRDGMICNEDGLADARRTSSIAKAYSLSPSHYLEQMRSFIPSDMFNVMELYGCRSAEFLGMDSCAMSSVTVGKLASGEGVVMSPLCVASFYASIGSGKVLRPHFRNVCHQGTDSSLFNGIDLGIITGALDTSGIAIGRGSVSSCRDYAGSPCAGATYAGLFPCEKPEFAVVCAIFGNGSVDVSAVASGMAERITSGM